MKQCLFCRARPTAHGSAAAHTSCGMLCLFAAAIVTCSKRYVYLNYLLQAVTARAMKVMISGAPAAGKGTQCARIVDKVGNMRHADSCTV